MTVDYGFKSLAHERHAVQVLMAKEIKCSHKSVAGRLLARILETPSPMRHYQSVRAFVELLEEPELKLLTDVELLADSGNDVYKELCLKELLPLKDYLVQPDLKTLCVRYDGAILAEYKKNGITELPFVVTGDVFDLFCRACGYGVEGQLVHPLDLPELGCKMVFASGGWKGNACNCILLKK